jgi:hypothetical protein
LVVSNRQVEAGQARACAKVGDRELVIRTQSGVQEDLVVGGRQPALCHNLSVPRRAAAPSRPPRIP